MTREEINIISYTTIMEKFDMIVEAVGVSHEISRPLTKVKLVLDAMMHDVLEKLSEGKVNN